MGGRSWTGVGARLEERFRWGWGRVGGRESQGRGRGGTVGAGGVGGG